MLRWFFVAPSFSKCTNTSKCTFVCIRSKLTSTYNDMNHCVWVWRNSTTCWQSRRTQPEMPLFRRKIGVWVLLFVVFDLFLYFWSNNNLCDRRIGSFFPTLLFDVKLWFVYTSVVFLFCFLECRVKMCAVNVDRKVHGENIISIFFHL